MKIRTTGMVLAGLLAGAAPATGGRMPQGCPGILRLEFLAEDAEGRRQGLQVIGRGVWASQDFTDSIVVRAVVTGATARAGGVIVAQLQLRAGRVVWIDAGELPNPEATDRDAIWLPASTAAAVTLPSRARVPTGEVSVEIGTIRLDSAVALLQRHDPHLEATALRVRAVLIGASAAPYRPASVCEGVLRLMMSI